jgi:hypothetical protein
LAQRLPHQLAAAEKVAIKSSSTFPLFADVVEIAAG